MMIIDLPSYIQQCAPGIAASTMSAIVKTESKGNIWAINLNRGQRLKFQPASYQQAAAWVEYLDKHGYNFDIGLGQININNVRKYGYHAIDMLEPCKNLKVASLILKHNYTGALASSTSSKEALYKAISAYNTGNYHRGFSNGYVQRVLNNASNHNTKLPPLHNMQFRNNGSALAQGSNSSKYNINNFSSRTILYAKTESEIQKSSTQFAQN